MWYPRCMVWKQWKQWKLPKPSSHAFTSMLCDAHYAAYWPCQNAQPFHHYVLTGELPIEAPLNIKTLTFIRSLLSTQPTREIVLRQYVMKESKTHSLVTNIQRKNFLWTPIHPTTPVNTPTKAAWKKLVKTAVIKKTGELITKTVQDKSTLSYLCTDFGYKQPHPNDPTVSQVKNPRQVIRACVKASVMTGTFPLHKEGVDEESRLCYLSAMFKQGWRHRTLHWGMPHPP